jgi:hypothetical protein
MGGGGKYLEKRPPPFLQLILHSDQHMSHSIHGSEINRWHNTQPANVYELKYVTSMSTWVHLSCAKGWVGGQTVPVGRFHVAHNHRLREGASFQQHLLRRAGLSAEKKDELKMTYIQQVKDYTPPLSINICLHTLR